MGAGVALADRFETAGRERGCVIRLVQNPRERRLHLGRRPRHEVVLVLSEQPLRIVPPRRHQRYATGKRFEHADRGNSRERRDVRAPRDVNRRPVRGKDVRHAIVGEPAAITDASRRELIECVSGIANTVELSLYPERAHRLDQVLPYFLRPFVVAPVPDPDEIPLAFGEQRAESFDIRRLVPGPRAACPSERDVALANDLPERQHAVVVLQIVGAHRCGIAHRAVVRIVEEQQVATAGSTVPSDLLDERMGVPLVDEDHVGAIERFIQIELAGIDAPGVEHGIRGVEVGDRRRPGVAQEIDHAPGVVRLVDADVVPAGDEIRRDAAQEVCVAVVPVRDQRMAEEDDPHDA